jgi:hypothetical protein
VSNSNTDGFAKTRRARGSRAAKSGVLPWVTVALLLATVFLFDNSQIVAGRQAPIWDAWAFYGPEFTLVADHARMSQLVLWDPWIAGGAPDFAEPQVGAASPINVLMGAIFGGTGVGFRAYWLLVWLLGPLVLLCLARHLGSPPWAAFVVALGFAFGSFYVGHAEHTSFVYSFSFLPLLVWRLDIALLSRRVRPAVETGAIWGLSALGGYPALTILNAGFLCLWAIGRLCVGPAEFGLEKSTVSARLRSLIVSLILVFGTGVLVLSPTYFAFFTESPGYTDRAGPLSRKYAVSSNELDPGTLTTFASPYLHLLKYPGLNSALWPKTDISAMGIYMGGLPFILAFLAILQRPQSAWRWWLAGIALFALACAMGDHLPIRGWLYDYCLLTRYFRHPAVFRGYSLFAAAILALLSGSDIDRASELSPSIWRRLLWTSVVAGSAALLAYYYVISHVSHLAEGLHRADRHVVLVWGGAILISLLFVFLPRIRTLLPAILCALAMMDASLTIRLSQPLVSDAGFFLPMWNRIDASHKRDLTLGSLRRDLRPPDWLTSAPNNNNISLKLPTLYNDSSMANRFHADFAQHPVAVNAGLGSDRIWFAKEVATVSPSDKSYNAFVLRSESVGSPVLVVHPPNEMRKMYQRDLATLAQGAQEDAISNLPPAKTLRVTLQRYTPNHLDFAVVCPDDGWLLVTDRWGNGWRAKVNGQPREVLGGDFIFRAVRVRAGRNKIEFSYRPLTYLVLLALSWGTLALILVIFPISSLWGGRERTAR